MPDFQKKKNFADKKSRIFMVRAIGQKTADNMPHDIEEVEPWHLQCQAKKIMIETKVKPVNHQEFKKSTTLMSSVAK